MSHRPSCLDLDRISASLREVQREFPRLNRLLRVRRDDLSDAVVDNMLAGYARVDAALADGREWLRKKGADALLDLNHVILLGEGGRASKEHAKHRAETARRFHDEDNGIRPILLWHHRHAGESPWKRAAGVYVRILSQPQLFVEGNHRTGALLMSWILARAGCPPFVLGAGNARAYFDPSSVMKSTHRASTRARLFRLPGLKKRFARFLEAQADPALLRR